MSLLTSRVVRFKSFARSRFAVESLIDVATNATIEGVRGNATTFQLTAFDSNGTLFDLSQVSSLNLLIRENQTNGSTAYAEKTIAAADLDLTTTLESWADGSQCHASFEFTNEEMNFDLGTALKKAFWLVITAILTSGKENTIAAGNFVMHEDNNAAVGPPPENPGAAITAGQALALIQQKHPDPILRTAAQGPPVNSMPAIEGSLLFEISETQSNFNDNDEIFFASDHDAIGFVFVQNPINATDVAVGATLQDSIENLESAMSAYGLMFASTRIDISTIYFTPVVGQVAINITVYNSTLLQSLTNAAEAIIGTPSDALDQACIVGDTGKNKLEYRSVQLDPVQWQLITAGVIWNETAEQFEKLIVRDGTIQTDIYSLT